MDSTVEVRNDICSIGAQEQHNNLTMKYYNKTRFSVLLFVCNTTVQAAFVEYKWSCRRKQQRCYIMAYNKP